MARFFRVQRRIAIMCTAFSCLVGLTSACDAQAQLRPRWNRKIEGVAVWPSPAGTPSEPRHDIHVSWSFDAEHLAGPLDLSTHVRVMVNGAEISAPIAYAIVVNEETACQPGPPCAGTCGSYTLDGVGGLDLACFRDGACSPGACDCDCGAWLEASVAGIPLIEGDQIAVRIDPAPGAASDDASDNLRSFTFGGGMIGWNRGLSGISARLSPDGDSMYVRVSSYVEFDGPPGALPTELNLDAVVEIFQDQEFLGSVMLEIPATHSGQECPESQCTQPCAVILGHEVTCRHGFANPDCVCGGEAAVPEVPTNSPTYLDRPITAKLKPVATALHEPLTYDNSATTSVVSVGEVPRRADGPLRQNFPNPFSPKTTIVFRLTAPSAVALEIFDLAGRHVRTLVRGIHPPGEWRFDWDGRSDRGERVPTGPYLYRLNVNGNVQARKLTILDS